MPPKQKTIEYFIEGRRLRNVAVFLFVLFFVTLLGLWGSVDFFTPLTLLEILLIAILMAFVAVGICSMFIWVFKNQFPSERVAPRGKFRVTGTEIDRSSDGEDAYTWVVGDFKTFKEAIVAAEEQGGEGWETYIVWDETGDAVHTEPAPEVPRSRIPIPFRIHLLMSEDTNALLNSRRHGAPTMPHLLFSHIEVQNMRALLGKKITRVRTRCVPAVAESFRPSVVLLDSPEATYQFCEKAIPLSVTGQPNDVSTRIGFEIMDTSQNIDAGRFVVSKKFGVIKTIRIARTSMYSSPEGEFFYRHPHHPWRDTSRSFLADVGVQLESDTGNALFVFSSISRTRFAICAALNEQIRDEHRTALEFISLDDYHAAL